MKYAENKILCAEESDFEKAGISINTVRKAKMRGSSGWTFHPDPSHKTKTLVEFEKLKDEYKDKLRAKFGNPYDQIARQPIRAMIKRDDKAEEFFLNYRYDGKALSTDHVDQYTMAASILNMLKAVNNADLKKDLKLTMQQFYEHVIAIIDEDKIGLPKTYRRLVIAEDSALKKYNAQGYASLVSWKFGNKLAAKVNDEVSESALIELISHPNQYDDVLIAMQYNKWAKDNDRKPIDPSTVGVWRRKRETDVIMYREGNAALKNKILRQVKGSRPTAPLHLIESDDNHLDLLFIDPNDTTQSKYYHKYKAIVVMDSFNDYVLGYAYAENLSIELVKAAYLNAMYHIRSITGAWYLPHETKTDNWAIESLRPFYKSLGKYMDTPVGSKNRGYIENLFGTPHWKRCLKLGANNYTGNNLTAKTRGVNMEVLNRNKKDYPLIGNEAIEQIENFFHRLRHLPQSTTMCSKHEQWLSAFNEVPADQRRMINDEQFLLKFGIEHNAERKAIRITNRGVEPQILGKRYSYDLVTDNLMELVGKEVKVVYDPNDMSRVLVTDFDKVRLMGLDARLSPRALKDSDADSRLYLRAVWDEKKDQVEGIAARSERRKQVLEENNIDAESLLQAGVMVKELKQRAEVKVLAQTIGGTYNDEDFIDQM